ncbi:MAG TPA: cupin domain-containing protein [Candidatus Omnitrophota bacterium]|nr:cupin domain-containing protein [Candidatus Omnitrophota bacterium]HPS36278.1 cupin domain-containing protein [Candidatus Omnitrophota bacterium]
MIKKRSRQEIETRKNMRGGTGEVTIRNYFKPEEIKARTRLCAEMTLPPGASIGLHDHVEEDEIYLIQKGTGIMTDGGKEVTVEAGDAILTGQGASHSIRNSGTEDLVVTAIIIKY